MRHFVTGLHCNSLAGMLKDDNATLAQVGIKNGVKLMLMGSTIDDVMQAAAVPPPQAAAAAAGATTALPVSHRSLSFALVEEKPSEEPLSEQLVRKASLSCASLFAHFVAFCCCASLYIPFSFFHSQPHKKMIEKGPPEGLEPARLGKHVRMQYLCHNTSHADLFLVSFQLSACVLWVCAGSTPSNFHQQRS